MRKWSVLIVLTSVIMLWLGRIPVRAFFNALEATSFQVIPTSPILLSSITIGIIAIFAGVIGIVSIWEQNLRRICFALGVSICTITLAAAINSFITIRMIPSLGPVNTLIVIAAVIYTLSAYKLGQEQINDKRVIALLMISVVLIFNSLIAVLPIVSIWSRIVFTLLVLTNIMWAIVAIVAGIIGIITFMKPQRANFCFLIGIIISISSLGMIIVCAVSLGLSSAFGVSFMVRYLYLLVLSLIYTVLAYKLKSKKNKLDA